MNFFMLTFTLSLGNNEGRAEQVGRVDSDLHDTFSCLTFAPKH